MASLLIVDDDRGTLRIFQRCFEHSDVMVHVAHTRAEAVKAAAQLQPDVVVLDIVLPDGSGLTAFEEIRRRNPLVPMVFVTASGTSDMAIESMRLGAMDYLVKPLSMGKIREVIGQAVGISKLIRASGTRDEGQSIEQPTPGILPADALIGHSPAMQEVYKAIGRVADQNVNVLIRGESGTGKERVARAIHRHSHRAAKRFLAVNCAAIPESLLESELFGHEKGAFTGAVSQHIGKFEECEGGTLFLDEVGDMPLLMQSKVLRAIQEKEFQRVGGNQTIKSDAWIVAATNRDLEALVADGAFRADLCYRLNGYSIVLPPFRDRREDIPFLVEYYVRALQRRGWQGHHGRRPGDHGATDAISPGRAISANCKPFSNMPCCTPSGRSWRRSSCRRSCARARRPSPSAAGRRGGSRCRPAAGRRGSSLPRRRRGLQPLRGGAASPGDPLALCR